MPKPIIGLTSYSRTDENRFTLPATYVEAVERAQGIPVVLTPTTENPEELVDRFDGFVLTGGADIDPDEYGGMHHEKVYGVNPERDRYELAFARALLSHSVPLLAICRGIQVLNVAMGGTLVEHIPSEYGDSILHRNEEFHHVTHPVSVDPHSKLAGIMGVTEFDSPSFHHQSVRDVAAGFRVCATAADGVIEAMESDRYPNVIAVQWHPEYVAASDPVQQRIFDTLIGWSEYGTAQPAVDTPRVAVG